MNKDNFLQQGFLRQVTVEGRRVKGAAVFRRECSVLFWLKSVTSLDGSVRRVRQRVEGTEKGEEQDVGLPIFQVILIYFII